MNGINYELSNPGGGGGLPGEFEGGGGCGAPQILTLELISDQYL